MENFGLGGGALNSKSKSLLTLASIFLLCTCIGTLAGTYIKHQLGTANAANENITVINNNQISTIDQGTPTIVRTSTVTVKDTSATLGYTLAARIENNSIPSSTVSIYSVTSTTCTQASPCTITSDPTPTPILETNTTNVTQAAGHTTDWTVTITLPGATTQGNYIVDIDYSEDPILSPPSLADNTNMQDATAELCDNTAIGKTVNLVDDRDGKYYRVRKMVDNRCWMIDNLAYDINSAPATGKPAYNPTAQLVSGGTAGINTRAQYVQNTVAYNIPNNGNSTPSYLYNWCAAMGDTSANCATTVAYTAGQPTTPQTGICPAPFRLPITGATPAPSTPGNGANQATAAATTTNEFAKLDIWMGGTGESRPSANTYVNFTTDNAVNPQLFFSGVLSGYYRNGLSHQDNSGYWWSSTAISATYAYNLGVYSNVGYVNQATEYKYDSIAVRRLL